MSSGDLTRHDRQALLAVYRHEVDSKRLSGGARQSGWRRSYCSVLHICEATTMPHKVACHAVDNLIRRNLVRELPDNRPIPEGQDYILALDQFERLELTEAGRAAVPGVNQDEKREIERRHQELEESRKGYSLRAIELRKYMLLWLFEQELTRHHPPEDWSDFRQISSYYRGGRVPTEQEVERQAHYLVDRGLLTGTLLEEAAPGCLRPRLTSDGQDCVTLHGGVVERNTMNHPSSGNIVNEFVVYGGVNKSVLTSSVNVGSQTQHRVEQDIAPGFEKVAEAVAAFSKQLASLGLTDEEQRDAEEGAGEILAEVVTPEPNRGKIKMGLKALMGFLAPVLVSGAGDGVKQLAADAIESLGNATF